jgi:putative oxidoreductase
LKFAERYLLTFMRVYLGVFNVVSGSNYFLRFWPQPVPHDPTGAAYMAVTLHLGLFQLAKVIELVGGLCLTFDIYVPFALVLLAPVTATVLVMDTFSSDLAHVRASGARNFIFHAVLFAAYARYYFPLLKLRAEWRPLWRADPRDKAADILSEAP